MAITLRYSSGCVNATELVNNAFLKIYKDLKQAVPLFGETVAGFTEWLRNEVINFCIEHLRTATSAPAHDKTVCENENTTQIPRHAEVLKSIQALSPFYKAVYNLFVIEGLSHAEIAGKLNISEKTSATNLFKARQCLLLHLNGRNFISSE